MADEVKPIPMPPLDQRFLAFYDVLRRAVAASHPGFEWVLDDQAQCLYFLDEQAEITQEQWDGLQEKLRPPKD